MEKRAFSPMISITGKKPFDKSENSSNHEYADSVIKESKFKCNTKPKPSELLKSPDLIKESRVVSKSFYNKEINKLDNLKKELIHCQKIFDRISNNLPDGGTQLLIRIKQLLIEIEIKNKYIKTLKHNNNYQPLEKPKLETLIKLCIPKLQTNVKWEDVSATVNQINPKHAGVKALATFNKQKALTFDSLKNLHFSLESCPAESVFAPDPIGLKLVLLDHQKHALAWMIWRERQEPCGGILADDMGLGKTLTTIALILNSRNVGHIVNPIENCYSYNKENSHLSSQTQGDYNGGTLIVCPASLVCQWENEIKTKVLRQRLSVCVHHGNNRDTNAKSLSLYDIVATTYNIVAREYKSHGALFNVYWKRIVLDEAHVIRNCKSQSSEASCKLKGYCRWALTGTPIQNKELDAYALLRFLRCSPFDELSYWKKWIDNKSAGGQQRLNTILKTIMLRRTKVQLQNRGELQCLPIKQVELIEVHLNNAELNVYKKLLIYSRTLLAQFLFQRGESDTNFLHQMEDTKHEKFEFRRHSKEIKTHEILVLLLRLRQICCHPGLIDSMLEDDVDRDSIASDNSCDEMNVLERFNKLAIKDTNNELENNVNLNGNATHILKRSNPVFNIHTASSKISKVLDLLKKIVFQTKDKAVIVSQWTSVLNILKIHFHREGITTLLLDGSVPVKDRQDIVNQFNDIKGKERVFLLSLTAGGVGLNLIGANHLLLIDLHWNPQLEAQAQDRVYRVGQKKNVNIYRFMCKDTVEERIKLLQETKVAMADAVLTGSKMQEGSKLTVDDLKNLFSM